MKKLRDILCLELYLIFVMFVLLMFLVVDFTAGKKETFHGKVIDKYYKPESNSWGVVSGTTGSGKFATGITTHHEDEEFIVILKTESGEIYSCESTPKLYYKKQINHDAEGVLLRGYFTGMVLQRIILK